MRCVTNALKLSPWPVRRMSPADLRRIRCDDL